MAPSCPTPGGSCRPGAVPDELSATGLAREGLYKGLFGEGNPSFATILKVTHALGMRLHADVSQKTPSNA